MFKGSDEEIVRKTGNGEILAPWVCINTDVYDLSPDTEGINITTWAGGENLLIYFNCPERDEAALPELMIKVAPKDYAQADLDISAMVKEDTGLDVFTAGAYINILLWDGYQYDSLLYEVEGDEIEGWYSFETDATNVHLAYDINEDVWKLTFDGEEIPR